MNSVWINTGSLPSFPYLEGDTKTDVLVIGGGLAGILTTHALTQAGTDCLLIEADTICGGVTGNTTAKITSQHGLIYAKLQKEFGSETARMYWQANQDALARYRALCQNISCEFERKDAFIYTTGSGRKLEQELDVLNRLKIPAEFTTKLPLPFSVHGAIRFPDQAQFHPLKFVAGLVPGLNIREHTTASAIEGTVVYTNHGKIQAENVIVATHFPYLNKHGRYFLKLYQERSYVLGLERAQNVDGMYLGVGEDELSFRNYGSLLLLGGSSHRTGKTGSGWSALEKFARRKYPEARVKYRWATQDCMTLDGIPYIGAYSRNTPNLYVATGFNKWGMTSSMAAATLLRDLVTGKENPYAQLFSPTRTMLRPQLAANSLEAAINLITPTKPRCPHLGCALKWNPHEHSWDCPCHGSRFDQKGKLLDNPATGDIEPPP